MSVGVAGQGAKRSKKWAGYESAIAVHGPSGLHWDPRSNFAQPIPAFEMAADRLSRAADAILTGDYDLARELVLYAEIAELVDHAMAIMSKTANPEFIRWRPIDKTALAPRGRVDRRAFPSDILRQMFMRDGWRCRFCGCRVVRKEARDRMRQLLPDAIRWTASYGDHAGFFVLTGVADHAQRHGWGGPTDIDNLVTACQLCNYGRGEYFLEEVGLIDPRTRDPFPADGWDGLERMLKVPRPTLSVEPTSVVGINMGIWAKHLRS
jgi:hypothetical protein